MAAVCTARAIRIRVWDSNRPGKKEDDCDNCGQLSFRQTRVTCFAVYIDRDVESIELKDSLTSRSAGLALRQVS